MAGDITTRESLQSICDEFGEDHILAIQFDSDHTERFIPGMRQFSMSNVVDYGDTTYIKCKTCANDVKTGMLDKPYFLLYPMQTIHTIMVADKSVNVNDIDTRYI